MWKHILEIRILLFFLLNKDFEITHNQMKARTFNPKKIETRREFIFYFSLDMILEIKSSTKFDEYSKRRLQRKLAKVMS